MNTVARERGGNGEGERDVARDTMSISTLDTKSGDEEKYLSPVIKKR